MKRWFVMAGVIAASLAAAGAQGDDTPTPGNGLKGKGNAGGLIEKAFKKMDANGDGKITLEEFKKAVADRPQGKLKDNPELASKVFERMDENGDGYVTLAEFKKFREKMAEKLKDAKPGEKKPDPKNP